MKHSRNIVLGPRYALRLGQLRSWHLLHIACEVCGHEGTLDPAQLRRRYPDHTRLKDLEARFACKQCGSRACGHWEVWRQRRD